MLTTSTRRQSRSALFQLFQRVYDKPVDGTGLAVFRIAFSAVLLLEVGHMFYFRHLIFDIIPFVEVAEIGVTTPLLLWMAALVCLLLGWFTRPAALVNYGFCLIIFASLKSYGYMMTPVYIGVSLLFLVLPISRCFSLDRLRRALRLPPTPPSAAQLPRTVSQLAYYAPVLVGLGFVYLDSALYKLTSPLWLAGLGMWTTLSLPYETILNSSLILNNEVLVKALGYLTLVFEFGFIFLFPFRRYRLLLAIIGLGLHLGILLTLAVPLFSLGFGSLYLLLVPAGWWRRGLARPAAWAERRLTRLAGPIARYRALAGRDLAPDSGPASSRPDETVPLGPGVSLRDAKLAGAALGLAGLTLLQCLVSYDTSLLRLLRRKSGLEATLPGRALARVAKAVEGPARNLLGITTHPIALDEHFAGYTRLVAVTYTGADGVERFLPLTRPSGMPGAYLTGDVWLKWTHLVVSHRIDQERLGKGIRSFTAFWATKNQVDLTSCRFKVKVKKIAEATHWQPDFLNQQIRAGWQDAGEVVWQNQQFTAHLADIETL